MSLFVDTWGWLALAGAREPAHAAVCALYADRRSSGVVPTTTDYVLSETATMLFKRSPFPAASAFFAGILGDASKGRIVIEYSSPARFNAAWNLRRRYRDKPRLSFVDLASFVVMRELRIREVLTADGDFDHVGLGFVRVPAG